MACFALFGKSPLGFVPIGPFVCLAESESSMKAGIHYAFAVFAMLFLFVSIVVNVFFAGKQNPVVVAQLSNDSYSPPISSDSAATEAESEPQWNSAPSRPEEFTNADYAAHVRQLKEKLPEDGFSIVVQKPFVVVGDLSQQQLESWANGTVKWAVDRIKRDYFKNEPRHILDIWLFQDKASYEKYNQLLFDTQPTTPYGYYSSANRALVMNISTGGGTLVHEIVHPFIESNFQQCPSWFNEGLASLYEQSRDENGRIMGSTNWRLRGLQLAIQDDRVPSFETLCSTTTREFYDGASTNYAQARYLCYYLQQHEKLVPYYHQFVKDVDADPTGYETLKRILGREDMNQFQRDWQDYVMKLRFP